MRSSYKFQDYNFKHYFIRKNRLVFKEMQNETDSNKIDDKFNELTQDLAVLKRQSIISQMYVFDKTVVEPIKST